MLERLGQVIAAWAARWFPDPFVFAALLTFLTFGLALVLTEAGSIELLAAWRQGLWSLLAFGMQMTLILVTGHAVAVSRPVFRAIRWLADRPGSGSGAAGLVATVACATALLNWGLGLIVGAHLARQVGRSAQSRGVDVPYPLLAAAGYTGLLVWHGGFSGSGPLLVNTAGHFLEAQVGLIPLTATIVTWSNFLVTGGLCVASVLLCAGLARSGPTAAAHDLATTEPIAPTALPPATGAARLQESRLLGLGLGLTGVVALLAGVIGGQIGWANLDLNLVNFSFLTAGLLLHGSLGTYLRAVRSGIAGVVGIVLLFPFYAGIMGVMSETGLAGALAERMLAVASDATLPLWTFVSAGLINLFVPSGGGQVAVQGPIVAEACARLGVPFARGLMALAYGDQWTNMLQPFWALPLLAITGLEAREILGYTIVLFLGAGLLVGASLLLMG